MPELPEVETLKNDLLAHGLVGEKIKQLHVYWPKTVSSHTDTQANELLGETTIQAVQRRGKYLLLTLSNHWKAVIHLRMSGKLYFRPTGHVAEKHEHVVVELQSGRNLIFHDTRKFGRWVLTENIDSVLGGLGPEPFAESLSFEYLAGKLKQSKRKIKVLLLDQSVIAGLGNIYVDEALWLASIHPERTASSLTTSEIQHLREACIEAIATGIESNGTTLGTGEANFYSVAGRKGRTKDRLNVFRREGEACPRCGNTITKTVVGQRGTHICLRCQTL